MNLTKTKKKKNLQATVDRSSSISSKQKKKKKLKVESKKEIERWIFCIFFRFFCSTKIFYIHLHTIAYSHPSLDHCLLNASQRENLLNKKFKKKKKAFAISLTIVVPSCLFVFIFFFYFKSKACYIYFGFNFCILLLDNPLDFIGKSILNKKKNSLSENTTKEIWFLFNLSRTFKKLTTTTKSNKKH